MLEALARGAADAGAISPRSASPTSARPRCCGIGPRGEPVARAIVWQDRRTAAACEQLRAAGLEPEIAARTGLLLDPYFSATKLAWLLDHVPGARARAERGELAFGTVDSWLLFKLTAHRRHVTDATNASRTLLFNLRDAALGRAPAGDVPRATRLPAARSWTPACRATPRSKSSSSPASNYR